MTDDQRFFGKYRATVVNNVDPMQQGRIQVLVPDVSSIVPSSSISIEATPLGSVAP